MRKSIAENLIKWLNVAVALVIAMVMVLCTDAKVSARDLGSNLVIKDTQALLSDINVNSTSTTSARQLIATGANVDVVEVDAVPSTIYYNNTNSWSHMHICGVILVIINGLVEKWKKLKITFGRLVLIQPIIWLFSVIMVIIKQEI